MTESESFRESRHLTEVVYTPGSPLRHPLRMLAEMGRDLAAARGLAWRIMVRDLSAQYRQSLLGFLWIVIPPIVTALGFTFAKNAGVVSLGETELPYPAYVMFSMTLWQTFTEALGAPVQAWTQARPMLTRVYFPRESLLMAKLGEVMVNLLVKLVLIVAIFVWFDMPVTAWAFLAPLALVPLILLGLSLGTVLACVGGLYQDVAKALPFLILVWLLVTPVIYPVPREGVFATLVSWNPVTPLLVTVRELATVGDVSDPAAFWAASGFTLACVVASWLVYRVAVPFVVERMSA